jgi:uncharacterized protein
MEIFLNSIPKGISGFVREGEITLPPGALAWKKVPVVKGFIDRQSEKYIIKARFITALELPCDRCLEPHTLAIDDEFMLIIINPENLEESGLEDDAIIPYPKDDRLELDDTIFRLIILDWPMKSLCDEKCKGLCPQCGVNLNHEQCNCGDFKIDPRWEALKSLKLVNR